MKLNRTGAAVDGLAFATAIIAIAAIALLQTLLYQRLPGRGPLVKGILFDLLLLAVRGRFPRMLVMNLTTSESAETAGSQLVLAESAPMLVPASP